VLFLLELPHREGGERPNLLELSEDGDLVVTIDDRNAEIFFGKDEWGVLKRRLDVSEDGHEKVQVRYKEVSHFDLGHKGEGRECCYAREDPQKKTRGRTWK